jgi:hypothetical protein
MDFHSHYWQLLLNDTIPMVLFIVLLQFAFTAVKLLYALGRAVDRQFAEKEDAAPVASASSCGDAKCDGRC